MASIRDLFVTIGFDIDDRPLQSIDRNIQNVKSSAKLLAGVFAGAAASVGFLLKEAGDMEQVEVAFETMLGSAEAARDMLEGLKEDARKTPFTLPGIIDSGKRLLAMGIEAENLRDTIKILGDVTAGVGIDKLPQLVLALGQVKAATKLRGSELRQFTEAGVPLLDELAKSLGKTPAEVQKMIEQGQISFDNVRKALEDLTTGSGRFANLMEKQSHTFLGILSNMKDFISINAIAIGKELLPEFKRIAKEMLSFLEANRKIIKAKLVAFFKQMVVVIGILYKTAKAVIEAILTLTDVFGGLGNVIKWVTLAIIAFSGAQILSAIGSIAIAIGRLATGMRALGVIATITQGIMMIWPILVGAAIIALIVIIEDLVGYFQGKDSITGMLIDAFEKKFPEAFGIARDALYALRDTAKIVYNTLSTWFSNLWEGIKQVNDFVTSIFGKMAGLLGLEGVAKFFGQGQASPASSPASSQSNVSNSARINAPITVNVPEGTSPDQVASATQAGVRDALDGVFRQAGWSLEPQLEY